MTSIILTDLQVSDCAINGETLADIEVYFDWDGDIEWVYRLDTGEEYKLTPYQRKMAYAAYAGYSLDLAEMHYNRKGE